MQHFCNELRKEETVEELRLLNKLKHIQINHSDPYWSRISESPKISGAGNRGQRLGNRGQRTCRLLGIPDPPSDPHSITCDELQKQILTILESRARVLSKTVLTFGFGCLYPEQSLTKH